MNRDPLVSIIMPLYNKRPYVERAVESIKKQTYPNWELIIVDDGSTDGSGDAVPRDDRRIRLFRQANRGPSAARNKAFEMASGDYIAFIDADDFYYPVKLEKEISLLWREQKAEWMMSAYDYRVNGVTRRYYMKDINNTEVRDETRVYDNALKQLTVAGWPSDGLFMSRSLFERLGGFHEGMRYGEITEIILRCALMQPRVVICHLPLYLHIDVPGSTAKTPTFKSESSRCMGESMYQLCIDYPEYSAYLMNRAHDYLIYYAASLILKGKGHEARKFLVNGFPLSQDVKWWKMWAGSWLPGWLIKGLVRIRHGR